MHPDAILPPKNPVVPPGKSVLPLPQCERRLKSGYAAPGISVYYPSVHCLVTAGGLSPGGKHWLPAPHNYLVPAKAVSETFRTLFRERPPGDGLTFLLWTHSAAPNGLLTAKRPFGDRTRFQRASALTSSMWCDRRQLAIFCIDDDKGTYYYNNPATTAGKR